MEEIQNILVCSKCVKENQYIIPGCTINTEKNEIEYKCYKHGIINENNLFDFKITKIIKYLNVCQIHKDEVYCGWCNICERNICQICIGDELNKKHDYILYNSLITEKDKDEFMKNLIINLKLYCKEIKQCYKDITNYEDDIKILEEIIRSNELYYNLVFKQKLLNYQILLNYKSSFNTLLNSYNKYESMYKEKYNIFLSFIKGKYINNISRIKLDDSNVQQISDIIILNSDLYDEEIKEYNIIHKNNNTVFALYSENKGHILIYNINGYLINKIKPKIWFKLIKIIQFKSNVLLFFYGRSITFFIFSLDFKGYSEYEIDLQLITDNEVFNTIRTYIPICSFSNENEIIKIENNRIVILYKYEIFEIKINASIFNNSKYNINRNKLDDLNKTEKYEIIHHYKYFLRIIPIYSTNLQNKGIINFIAINFEAEQDKEDELFLLQNSQNILIQENVQYSKPDYILRDFTEIKYSVKLKNFITQNEYALYENFLDFYKSKNWNENAMTIMKKIKIYVNLYKYNKNFDNNDILKFKLKSNDSMDLLKNKNNYCNLVYSYEKNCILFLLNNVIYQIDFNTNEVVSIYELEFNIGKENELSQYYILRNIHYYNKDLNKIEELFLFKNTNSDKYIYPYYWDNEEIREIKPFYLPDFKNIFEINFLESSNNVLIDSLDMERILVISNGIVIFK